MPFFTSYAHLLVTGYNVAVLAYGQTGTGKTHSMVGGPDLEEGIIPRAVRALYDGFRDRGQAHDFGLRVAYYEVSFGPFKQMERVK